MLAKDWQHAGGARDLQSATVFPESCHSVTRAKVLLLLELPFSQKRSLQQSYLRGVNTLAFWTPRSGPPRTGCTLPQWTHASQTWSPTPSSIDLFATGKPWIQQAETCSSSFCCIFHMYKPKQTLSMSARSSFHWGMSTFWWHLRCAVFSYVQTPGTLWKHVCAAHSIGESHAMATPRSAVFPYVQTPINLNSRQRRKSTVAARKKKLIELFKFWEAASIVSLGETKMASFLRSNFGFEFGAKVCLFWSLWQVIPDWLVLEATGCEQRELSLLCCGSTSMIPAATGEAHFCAPAFSYVLRSKKRGCCFFPLRKCIFSVAATFWVAKLDFLCCWFFSCLGRFFSCLGRVFSRLGRFFPAASKMHFFCCKGAFVLLQGVFSAALNFSRCEAAFFAGIFPRCRNSFFPLQGVFFLLPNVFFSVPMFFSCCEPVFFARCAKTRS